MATAVKQSDHEPIRDAEDLCRVFREAEKPASAWRIGAEAEKFGVDASTGTPVTYDGARGVLRVFASLIEGHGWVPEREQEDGPIIALRRESASVTLEPGAQLELSGAALPDIHAICAESRGHMQELRVISDEMNVVWLGVGFQPLARPDELPWVPKQRYGVMKSYLPTRGSGALDMMRRTATVQANYDYADEADAMRKLQVSLRLSPLAHAMLANAPFFEGKLSGKKSLRGEVWLNMDPHRSGLIPALWRKERPRYRDYVEWALDAGMFLFKRGDRVFANTGQSFRDFLKNGFEGERATHADWKLHLNTLFPEVRLKSTLETRSVDSLPTDLACALPALFTGILYDERALSEAEELTRPLSYEAVERARPELIEKGLAAELQGQSVRALAERLVEIAQGGLRRRKRLSSEGRDETIHLARLAELVAAGKTPADVLVEGLGNEDRDLRREILARTRL
ncbi:MAG TPA: glutamate-cysteine ligase family protein [Polyangiaceae bacterium]|nr:glutamate-cysteine ligase family protein [Polyangiaceae bacterium]